MRTFLSARTAADVLLAALGLLALFHVLVLAGIMPAGIVWGGRAADPSVSVLAVEGFSLGVTVLFGLVVAAKAGRLRLPNLTITVRMGVWVVFAYFALNTLGNLTSSSSVEKVVFSAVSGLLALLALRVAVARPSGDPTRPV